MSSAVGTLGRTMPQNRSQSGFKKDSGWTAVISATTRLKAWVVSSVRNGSMSATL